MAGKRTKKNAKGKRAGEKPRQRTDEEIVEFTMKQRPRAIMPTRARRPVDADQLRHSFMVWDEGWRKRTATSARPALNSLKEVGSMLVGSLRVPMYKVWGSASRVREFSDGTVRLLLTAPAARGADGETVVIDDHVWLDLSRCNSLFADAVEMQYGDLVTIVAGVGSYEKDGARRLGVGYWGLVGSSHPYYDNGAKKMRRIPKMLGGDAYMAKCMRAGEKISWTYEDPARLDGYLRKLASNEFFRQSLDMVNPDSGAILSV